LGVLGVLYEETCKIIDNYLRLKQAGDLHFNEIAELIHVNPNMLMDILTTPRNAPYIKMKMVEYGMDMNGILRSVDSMITSNKFTDLEIASLMNIGERFVRYRRRFKEKHFV
jgi:hypothetical protein